MRLRTKFYLGIVAIFTPLALGIALLTIDYVNTNTIREAENRVSIYARAAREIHSGNLARTRSALVILAQDHAVRELFRNPEDEQLTGIVQVQLEALRQEEGMDILNLLTPTGTVILRTRPPYHTGDSLIDDPMVKLVIMTRQSGTGDILLDLERLNAEGDGLVERCVAAGEEPTGMLAGASVPVVEGGHLIGIIQMGRLLNGAVEEVDKIRNAVFENEYYRGKPVGTSTIFLGNTRISTNVQDDQGKRAVGTRVSEQVAKRVLQEGRPWTGRAFVVDAWYLSQYDPIRDLDGQVIGMRYVGELEQKYLDMRTRTVASHLSIILAAMILAFLLSSIVIRGIISPIHTLSEATRLISAGDFAHRVGTATKDEIGELSASFNDMAEQLERQRQEIERRQANLESISKELARVNRNYMEMLGFVTHELKNPLSSAIMSLHTVMDGYLGEITTVQRKSLESVAKSLDYFHDMIKNYLDLSRLEKGELQVNKHCVSLRDVVVPVIEGLERELVEKQMVVENRIAEDTSVFADANLLRVVYDNLLSNAIKYGNPGGMIALDAQENNSRVRLGVRNDGEGIPPEKMSLLFGKFSRLNSPAHARKKGTGLGLYICKEIIEKHGGRIWIDSEMGKWVKFSFTLPK
jgi:two-component system NtrC family sensor kinase